VKDKKPAVSMLVILMVSCFFMLTCTIALVELGVWLYYQFILHLPSGMHWQTSLSKALRSGVAVGPIAGLGVWLNMWLEYHKGRKR